jgi:putative redox protein
MPTIHATVTQLDRSASLADVRGHQLTIDRPEAKGGQNKGPMGGEALLMGLGGCFMSNLLAAAGGRNIALRDARAEIEGDLADAPPRYTAIRMRVSADCEPATELAKLVLIADRGCIVANTLRQAVDLSVECVART